MVCALPICEGVPCCGHMLDHAVLQKLAPNLVGNGGFSLRRRSAMLRVLDKFAFAGAGLTNEDTFFCHGLAQLGGVVAPRDVALTFAVEQVPPTFLSLGKPAAVGLHKCYAYLRAPTVAALLCGITYSEGAETFQETWASLGV
jgi:hypothetical protein